MASSLPYDVGGNNPSNPAQERLNKVTGEDVKTSYGSEGLLNIRKRATTTNVVTSGTLFDRRSKSGSLLPTRLQAPLSVPHLKNQTDIPASSKKFGSQLVKDHSSVPESLPSAPIDIPIRKKRSSQPTTPLTGREPSFFPHFLKDAHTPPTNPNPKGFTPSPDSLSQSSQSEQEQFPYSPINRRSMRNYRGGALSSYTPTSPLSPTMPSRAMPSVSEQNARRHSSNHGSRQPAPLVIPSLPPYHPANYELQKSSTQASHSSSSSHGRQLSAAQKKLQRYQRELIVNATRTVSRPSAKIPMRGPSSPRLDPLSSPGPITPLALEGQSDYFLGEPNARSSAVKDDDRREMAERLIGIERDRIRHPERVERRSPAVSPAA
ncbi:MAG: hypothetical protein Q9218_002792 [Villophora microphyllina]